MARVIILSDSEKQNKGSMQAKDLFCSNFFKNTYKYASLLNPDYIYIITSKYGIVSQEEIISSYKKDVYSIDKNNLIENNLTFIQDLTNKTNLVEDEFILLCKERHNKLIVPWLINYSCPFEGLSNRKKINKLNSIIFEEKMKKIKYKNYKKVLYLMDTEKVI